MRPETMLPWLLAALAVLIPLAFWRGRLWLQSLRHGPQPGTVVRGRRFLPPDLQAIIGAILLVLCIPLLLQLSPRPLDTLRDAPGLAVGVVLALVAVGLFLSGLFRLLRAPVARPKLLLESAGSSGLIAGRVRLPLELRRGEPIKVRLLVQKAQLIHHRGGEIQLLEAPLWAEERTIRVERHAGRTELPFLFSPPPRLPGAEAEGARVEWLLEVGLPHRPPLVMALPQPDRSESPDESPSAAGGLIPTGWRTQQPVWLQFVTTAFVAVFAALIWIVFTVERAGWEQLPHRIPGMLWRGAAALVIFAAILGELVLRIAPESDAAVRWQRWRLALLAGAAGSALGALIALVRLLHRGLPLSFDLVSDIFVDAVAGMLMLAGLLGLLRLLWLVGSGRQRKSGAS
ncbi:MAG: hypothetical protein D6761_06575 [Candidatus Dadabacteria bacterium]|nr:MAG: hypothetical protein D6761_06575 [Candidatus Dadabacteria bacterium]